MEKFKKKNFLPLITRCFFPGSHHDHNLQTSRHRIVVSTPRCGRGNPGSNPGGDTNRPSVTARKTLLPFETPGTISWPP